MDIKTRIQDEELFTGRGIMFFNTLNKKGIYTVEDYINTNVKNQVTEKQFRVYQGILSYKYCGTPLVVDVLLDKKYSYSFHHGENTKEITEDMKTLGFTNFWTGWGIDRLYDENHEIRLIDIVDKFPYKPTVSLKNFYLNYYNTKMKKGAYGESVDIGDKAYLESLKKELVYLSNQVKELAATISSLEQQIKNIEEGKFVNGSK